MKRSLSGYTLIEALIVIAVTSTIFVGAVRIFDGARDDVDFMQAKADIDSKIKGYVNEVSTGVFDGSTSYSCQRDSTGYPILISPTPSISAQCIYLGKALQAIDGSNVIYVYDVLGLKNNAATGLPATTYEEVMPEPAGELAGGSGPFSYLFVDEYTLPNDLRIAYSRVNGQAANILKIYSNITTNNTSSRGILVYSNDYQAGNNEAKSQRLRNCIREDGGICETRYSLEKPGWDLCVQNSNGSKRAKLNIKPTATGVITSLQDGVC